MGRGHIRVLRAGGVGNTVSGIGTILASQALLLFLSIHTTKKRLKPQTHVLLSCAVADVLTALLGLGVFFNLSGRREIPGRRSGSYQSTGEHFVDLGQSLGGVEHCFLCISLE